MPEQKRSPAYTITIAEATLDEIGVWVEAVEATAAAITAPSIDHEHRRELSERALQEALNLLRILTRRLFSTTAYDGDVSLFLDRSCGPHAIGRIYSSGLTGAVIFHSSAEGNWWSSHT